jgi:hypothetical protein
MATNYFLNLKLKETNSKNPTLGRKIKKHANMALPPRPMFSPQLASTLASFTQSLQQLSTVMSSLISQPVTVAISSSQPSAGPI